MDFLSAVATYRNEYLASVAATLSIFMVVSANSWVSPALPKLFANDSPISITADEGSWMVDIGFIGAIFGPFFTWACADRIGRKWTLLGCFVPVVIGWILVGLGDAVWYLYVSRFLFGAALGMAYATSPMYLGEIASKTIRGTLGALITVMAKMGVLVMYCVVPYVEYRTLAWISMGAPVLFVACCIWMPESPYYLLKKNREEAAAKTLVWLRRTPAIEEEMQSMKASLQEASLQCCSFKELFTKQYGYSLRIMLVLVLTMQFTDLNAVLSYIQSVFKKISTILHPEEMSIVLAAVQLIAVIFLTILVDRIGRRPLLLQSVVGATLALVISTTYFAVRSAYDIDYFSWLVLATLLLYIICYHTGLATVPFVMLSEIFPINIRAFGNAVAMTLSALVAFGVAKMFQATFDYVGPHVPLGILGVAGVLCSILIFFFIPETKGKSLDEVQRMVASGELEK